MTAIGQGVQNAPPEPSLNQGPAERWALTHHNLSFELAGHQGSIPRKEVFNQELGRKAGGVPSISGSTGSSRQGTIPRSPFPSLPRIPSSRSTREGSDYGQARAAERIRTSRTHPVMSASLWAFEVLSRGGWSPASKTGAKQMSRKDAHAFAASLAATLMVSIVVFQAGDGTFGAVPADEIDGDEVQVLVEIDPWA